MTPERGRQMEAKMAVLSKVHLTGTGEGVWISNRATLDSVASHLIDVGDYVTITAGVCLLTHDALGKILDGRVKYGRIIIGNHVAIGVKAVLLPGVRIGDGSIIGAGAVVVSGTDVPAGEVWGGNPARRLGTVEQFIARRRTQKALRPSELEELQKGGMREKLAPLETVLTEGK